MPTTKANGITLYYEESGDPAAPAIVLIMGLGRQMIAWPEAFIANLAGAGYRVIAFDNRDIGLSTHLHDAPVRSLAVAIAAQALGVKLRPAYSLTDMANDTLGLMDALDISAAHIVGVSMGGMIAQIIAATAPSRTLSLTSIMSTSGARGLPGPAPGIRRQLMGPRRGETAIDNDVKILELTSYPDPARPAGGFRDFAQTSHDRAYNPRGIQRQLLAILADGSRADRLPAITAPTLVIHGAADPLIPVPCGKDTAARINGARFELVEAMAHDLPPSQMPHLARLITEHARGAG